MTDDLDLSNVGNTAIPPESEHPLQTTPPPKPRSRPKWEETARDRIRQAIKRYSRPLADLAARDANEGDTRLLVTDFLCDGLGYDKYADLTTEYRVKGEFADFGIRMDGESQAFIEVKRVGTKIGPKHLRQIQSYCANEGVQWMILTNGSEWQVYHLSDTVPLVNELLVSVDLLGPEGPAAKISKLFYLSREAMKRNQMEELWKAKRATCPQALGELLRSPALIEAMRKELRRRTGYKIEAGEIIRLLDETVLRPDCLQ